MARVWYVDFLFNFKNVVLECDKCEEWFHYKCLGFAGTELDASLITFICHECICQEKLENIKILKELFYLLINHLLR